MNLRLIVIVMVALYLFIELLELLTEVTQTTEDAQRSAALKKKISTLSTVPAAAGGGGGGGANSPLAAIPGESAATTKKRRQLHGEVAIEEAIRSDDVTAFLNLVSPTKTATYSVKLHGDLVSIFINQGRDWTDETDTMFKKLLDDEKLGARINGDGNVMSPLKNALMLEGKSKAIERLIQHPFIHPYVTAGGLSCKAIARARMHAPSVIFIVDASAQSKDERCFRSLLTLNGGGGPSSAAGGGGNVKTKAIEMQEYLKLFGGKKGGAIALNGEDTAAYQQRLDERAAMTEAKSNAETAAAAEKNEKDGGGQAGGQTNDQQKQATPVIQDFPADSIVMNPTGYTDPFQALYAYFFGSSVQGAKNDVASPLTRMAIWGTLTFLISGVLSGSIIALTVLAPTPAGGDHHAAPQGAVAMGAAAPLPPAAALADGPAGAPAPPPPGVV